MDKSIEDIWSAGFMNSNELIAPKVTNLYNQKSKLLLVKFKKTYQTDNKTILPIALLFGIGFSLFGHYTVGLYGMFLMVLLFFYNKRLLQLLETIEVTSNSYNYLTSYRKGIQKITTSTTRLLAIGLPIAIIPGYWLFFKGTEKYADIVEQFSSLQLLLFILGITIFLSLLGILVYKITTKLVYGTYLSKLDDIIDDMNTLNS